MTMTRERLRELFGMESNALRVRTSDVDVHGNYRVERLSFESDRGDAVRGFLTRPAEILHPRPAILYAHAHGARYDIGASELLKGRPALLNPLGPVLAEAGYVSLCIDMPTFGDRANISESAASKAAIWYGKSLFGQMLEEQAAALTYLASRSDVDARHIGAFGISMGSLLSFWLAAVDTRIAAVAHLCCYADFATMIETGAHDGHGVYLLVPGLLSHTSPGRIAGLVAPRPQLICVGTDDALTPPLAVDRAWAETLPAYMEAGAPDAVTLTRENDIGHEETPAMREAMLRFFATHLRVDPSV
ncbi:MAG TPA: dienelactone hydrolase family protein [Devosiaceae bacterium]|jgi:dienelactone hydrolase